MENYEKYANNLANYLKKDYNTKIEEKYKYIDKKIFRKINLPMASACEDGIANIISEVLNSKYNYLVDVHLKRKKTNGERKKSYRPDIVIINPNTNDDKIEIVGIIEVKAQMGYCPIYEPDYFKKEKDELDQESYIEFSEEEMKMIRDVPDLEKFLSNKLHLKEEKECWKIKYTLSKSLKILVVNVLASNHEAKIEKTIYNFDHPKQECNDIYFYTLFGNIYENNKKIKVWYRNLDVRYVYENNTKKSKRNYKRAKEEITIDIEQKEREKHGFKQFINDLQKFFK